MYTIKFDRSCAFWLKNYECNTAFLQMQKQHFDEKLLAKGYAYLNDIYETLGVKWDPTRENICWHGRPIWIEIEPLEDYEFMVKIS